MGLTLNSGNFKPVNNYLFDIQQSDVILAIQGNKIQILKNRYGIPHATPTTIIDLFSRSLICNIGLFEEGFKSDLTNSISKVFKRYNLDSI